MITPVRNANNYAQRVAGSRVVAGARNVAQVSDTLTIETAAATKRTGAQEESLINESVDQVTSPETVDAATKAAADVEAVAVPKTFEDNIADSLAWNQRVREATEAYRNTIENLDKTHPKIKPGDVYDSPF